MGYVIRIKLRHLSMIKKETHHPVLDAMYQCISFIIDNPNVLSNTTEIFGLERKPGIMDTLLGLTYYAFPESDIVEYHLDYNKHTRSFITIQLS